MRSKNISDGVLAALLVVLLFCWFYISPIRQQTDSTLSIPTAFSILHGNWGWLSDSVDWYKDHSSLVRDRAGHALSGYPVGPSLFALPIVGIADAVFPYLDAYIAFSPAGRAMSIELEAITVSFYCALAGGIIFLLVKSASESALCGIVAALVFGLASPIYSTATRGLWQHGPVAFCAALTLWLLFLSRQNQRWVAVAAIPVALAIICRPWSVVILISVTVYIAIYHIKELWKYCAVGGCIALVWVLYNFKVWGGVVPGYYLPGEFYYPLASTIDKVIGNLVSPSRGLFVFFPVFVFSVIGPMIRAAGRRLDGLDVLSIVCVVAQVGLIALSPVWWAGHAFGPRFMADVVPFLVFLMYPAIKVAGTPGPLRAQMTAVAFSFLGLFSFAVNLSGSFLPETFVWNVTPGVAGAQQHYNRLWDWRDLQFLRGTALEYPHPMSGAATLVSLGEKGTATDGASRHFDFSSAGSPAPMLIDGWSGSESWGTWSEGERARLLLPLRGCARTSVRFTIAGWAYTAPGHAAVDVEIGVNGHKETVTFTEGDRREVTTLTVPAKIVGCSAARMTFVVRSPASPASLGLSSDVRMLGFALRGITVTPD